MADAVQVALDRCVETLEELRDRGIFTASEVKKVAAKRREHEYRCRRHETYAEDFRRYIEYEKRLDKLREVRRKRLGVAPSRSDSFGVRHLNGLYTRACDRFPADVALAREHIAYATATKSKKVLNRLYARVLQLHPTVPGLWIEAANREFFDQGNGTAGRALMQRGLRHNRLSPLLWLQYFRMEWLCLQKLALRREKLGIEQEAPTQAPAESTVPEVVFRSAIEALPEDVMLRVQMLQCTAEEFGDLPGSQHVREIIISSLVSDFPSNEVAWEARAMYSSSSIKEVFKAAVKAVPTETMWLKYYAHLEKAGASEEHLKAVVLKGLASLEKMDKMADELRLKLASIHLRAGNTAATRSCLQGGGPASSIFLAHILVDSNDSAAAVEVLKSAISRSSDDISLRLALIEVCQGSESCQEAYRGGLQAETADVEGRTGLALAYLDWSWQNLKGESRARQAFEEIKVALGPKTPPELWLAEVKHEMGQSNATRLRTLFEEGLARFPLCEELWRAYMDFEESGSASSGKRLASLLWRHQQATQTKK
jgi:hypothetical protein